MASSAFDRNEFFANVGGAVNALLEEALEALENNVASALSEEERPSFHEAVENIFLKLQEATSNSLEQWQASCEAGCFRPRERTETQAEVLEQPVTTSLCPQPAPVDAAKVAEADAELVSLRSRLLAVRRQNAKLERERIMLEKRLRFKREKVKTVTEAARRLREKAPLLQAEIARASAKLEEQLQAAKADIAERQRSSLPADEQTAARKLLTGL